MRIIILALLIGMTAVLPVQAASVCSKKTCVEVEVVSTLKDMERGLQGREGLDENKGMLFAFTTNDFHRFWMKEMKFPIDILWLDENGKIITVVESAPACVSDPCTVYSSAKLSRFVLEVRAGFARRHQFKAGTTLKFNKGIH